MVLCHTNDIMDCNYTCIKWIGVFFMPLFFFISGCLSKDKISPKKLKERLWKRLLIPYLVWGIVMLFLINKTFWVAVIDHDLHIITNHINQLLLGDFLWYVPCLICIEILNYFLSLYKIPNKLKFYMMIVSLFYLCLIQRNHLPWHIDTAVASLLYYYAGYFYVRKGYFIESKIASLIIVVIFAAMAVTARYYGVVFDIHQHILTHPFLIILLSIIGVLSSVNLTINFDMGRIITLIGSNSLFIYIFHYKILCFLKAIVCKMPICSTDYFDIAIIVVMMIISITLCNLIVIPINKYCPTLIGNKKQQ